MLLAQINVHANTCLKCKHRQEKPKGGFKGPCACTIDKKDITFHIASGYCPAGLYPFVGLGSVIGWLLWRLRIPQTLRLLKLFDPTKCKCALRQAKVNGFGDFIKSMARRIFRWK